MSHPVPLTLERIAELEAFEARSAGVLSVYLDLDPARQVQRSYRVAFENLVADAHERLPEAARAELSREEARARAWLADREPRGKGLALFSCGSPALWHAYALAVRVRDHLAFERRPDVAPLRELVDEYERYVVALVDRVKARLFTVFMGEIEELDAFEDEVPGKHDWHLARVARRLAELSRHRPFDRLVLAGPEEATSALRRRLPGALAHRVVGAIPAELFASKDEILEKTLAIDRRIEGEVEERLLDDLLDMIGPGGRATVGVRPTLDALWADSVQTLLVADGVHVTGSDCPNCGRLEPGNSATCPACGKAMRPAHDLIHRAMVRAMEQGESVEMVHGAAGRRLVEAGGGPGALLRHQVAAACVAGR